MISYCTEGGECTQLVSTHFTFPAWIVAKCPAYSSRSFVGEVAKMCKEARDHVKKLSLTKSGLFLLPPSAVTMNKQYDVCMRAAAASPV